jgi:hypothetical protein
LTPEVDLEEFTTDSTTSALVAQAVDEMLSGPPTDPEISLHLTTSAAMVLDDADVLADLDEPTDAVPMAAVAALEDVGLSPDDTLLGGPQGSLPTLEAPTDPAGVSLPRDPPRVERPLDLPGPYDASSGHHDTLPAPALVPAEPPARPVPSAPVPGPAIPPWTDPDTSTSVSRVFTENPPAVSANDYGVTTDVQSVRRELDVLLAAADTTGPLERASVVDHLWSRLASPNACVALGLGGRPGEEGLREALDRSSRDVVDALGLDPTHPRAPDLLRRLDELVAVVADPRERFVHLRAHHLGVDVTEAKVRAQLESEWLEREVWRLLDLGRGQEALPLAQRFQARHPKVGLARAGWVLARCLADPTAVDAPLLEEARAVASDFPRCPEALVGWVHVALAARAAPVAREALAQLVAVAPGDPRAARLARLVDQDTSSFPAARGVDGQVLARLARLPTWVQFVLGLAAALGVGLAVDLLSR